MSEGNQGTKEDENDSLSGSDDSLDEIIDIENGPQCSDSHPSVSSEQSLFGYVASGIDVQISDIVMIEYLSDEIHARSSDEILTSPSNECETNLDEENGSQLTYTYFNNSDLCQEEDLQKLEACSFSQNSENYGSSLNTCNKKGENISGCIEGTIDARNKNTMKEMPQEEISSTDKQKQKSQVIENPCTQIFKFMHPKPCEKSFLGNNKSDLLRCPDYESDEFADVEDNAKDSSSDNNESTSDMRELMVLVEQDGNFFPERRDVDEQGNKSMERRATEFPDSPEICLKDVSSASHHSQSYNIGASCSHTPDHDPKQVPDSTGPAKSEEKKVKFKFPTIEEVEYLNHRMSPKDNKSARNKPNPLKMKTKVGMSKDKCNVCRVRLGLCAIRCRCGGYYCAKHRYDKEHNCTFDYKSMGAEEIRKNNPRVVAEKVRKL